jgi:PAS domain S-box-containing protein
MTEKERLKESEERFRSVLNNSLDVIYRFNLQTGHYEYMSPAIRRLGFEPEEMTAMTNEEVLSRVHPDDLSALQTELKRLAKTGQGHAEYRFMGKDGVYRWWSNEMVIVNDENGKPLYRDGSVRDTTEHKKVVEALRQSEMKFKSLAENAPDAIMRFDKHLRILYLNPQDLVATGKSLDEVVGKTNEEIGMPAELCKLWNGLFDKAKTSGQVQQVEFDFNTPGGIKTFNLRIVPEFAEDGSLISYVGISRDVTERKQMQEKLEEYARNLEGLVAERTKKLEASALYARGLIEASLDPLVTINAEGKITDVNKATETATGYSREKLVGSDFSDYFVKPSEARRGYMQVFQKGYVKDYPLTIHNKSGKIIDVLYNATIFRNEAGEVAGVFAAARDMTEHKKAEEAFLNERKRLFDVLETLPAMVCLLTSDHYVDFANRSFRDRFGDSEGRHCYDYCFGNKEPCSFCESYKPLETGKPHHWEVNAPDGSVIDAYDFLFTDIDGSRKILEMDLDITERRRIEKQLKDSERLAAIGATAGMVGHDIRNPLQAMTSDVYLAKLDLESLPNGAAKDSIRESLDGIEKNIGYVNKIVQDLQDYARPLTPVAKETDLESVFNDVLIKRAIPENIEVSWEVETEAKMLIADPDLLKRMLANLINNAVQAMPKGGKLTVRAGKKSKDVIITVEDTGIGIPEEAKDKLFTPMFTTKSKGQGFGLAVVKRITEALGGEVTYESEVGKGTKFIVRLPHLKELNSKLVYK